MSDGLLITIDGRDHKIPDDLDLNDIVALEDEGYSLEQMDSMKAVRFVIWRLLVRTDPAITIEEAGAKVPLSLLGDSAEEEEPPPIPLPVQAPRSGTSGGDGNGNGSQAAPAKVEIHEASGTP
jgi:hypothetical protein